MDDQQYLPLPEGAKRIDKGLRQRAGNLLTFSALGRNVRMEKKRSEKEEEGVPEDEKRVSRRKK